MTPILLFVLVMLSIPTHPHSAALHLHQGIAAFDQKNASLAIAEFTKALEYEPTNYNALYSLGSVFYYQDRSTDAAYYFKQCLAQNPTDKNLILLVAMTSNSAGDYELARDLFESLRDEDPRHGHACVKLLPIYIRNMEWYYALKFCRVDDLWWYNENIQGKTVLLDLSSEWNGRGDVFQIVRYAKHLHTAGAQVTVNVRPELTKIISLCPYINRVITPTMPKPTVDKTYNLLADSCTIRMRDTLYQPSRDVRYLYADKKLIAEWHQELSNDPQFKVGLCFQSSKMRDYFTNAILPGPRSMPLSQLAPLANIKNVSLYSLQLGELDQIKSFCAHNACAFLVYDLDSKNGDFMDTAAFMKNLDLVITVDTSIAHLAGGLGVPVWVMLPFNADFRWFANRSDCPWYPTMRLFRQPQLGDWNSVVNDVVRELKKKSTAIMR